MSDLQIILIVIGVLIIIGVIIFNWWQERKFYQHVENSFSSLKNDALLDDPKLDVRHLYDAIHDETVANSFFDETLAKESLIDQVAELHEDNSADAQPLNNEDLLISEQILEIPASIDMPHIQPVIEVPDVVHGHAGAYQESDQKILSNDIKSVSQHADIKSIFIDVFNRPSTDLSHTITSKTVPASIETQAADIHDQSDEKEVAASIDGPEMTLPAMLHPQMDLTAVLYLAKETPASALTDDFLNLITAYDKSVFVYVLDVNQQWSLLRDMRANSFQQNKLIIKISCSLQLADRAGAASRNTINRFQLAVETLGLDINAHVEWQGAGDALVAAKDIDAFCIEVDKTIGFHLVHGESGAFTGTKLRGLAEAQGLMLASDGTFKFFDKDVSSGESQLQPSFVMFNRDDYPFSPDMLRTSVVKGITFQLDIPHVKHCTEAYSQMVHVAKQMEHGLNALLVAENNKTLGDIQIEKIRQQLKVIHATMLTRGIVPGSDNAFRLFS